jgi:hypothetical protein
LKEASSNVVISQPAAHIIKRLCVSSRLRRRSAGALIDEETDKRCESINRRRSDTPSQTYKQEPSVLDPRSRENYANGSNYRSVLGVESKSAVVIEEASRSRKSRAHGEWASAHVTFGAILSNKEWSPRQR